MFGDQAKSNLYVGYDLNRNAVILRGPTEIVEAAKSAIAVMKAASRQQWRSGLSESNIATFTLDKGANVGIGRDARNLLAQRRQEESGDVFTPEGIFNQEMKTPVATLRRTPMRKMPPSMQDGDTKMPPAKEDGYGRSTRLLRSVDQEHFPAWQMQTGRWKSQSAADLHLRVRQQAHHLQRGQGSVGGGPQVGSVLHAQLGRLATSRLSGSRTPAPSMPPRCSTRCSTASKSPVAAAGAAAASIRACCST